MKNAYFLLFTTISLVAFDNSSSLPAARQVTRQEIQELDTKYQTFIIFSDSYKQSPGNPITLNSVFAAAAQFRTQYERVFDKTSNRSAVLSGKEAHEYSRKLAQVNHNIDLITGNPNSISNTKKRLNFE